MASDSGLITGNTYIMKPSERDPTACLALVELLREAGAPDGTVNIIHGQHDCVNFICDHSDIRAIRQHSKILANHWNYVMVYTSD